MKKILLIIINLLAFIVYVCKILFMFNIKNKFKQVFNFL